MNANIFASPREFFAESVREALISRKVQANPLVEPYLVDLLQYYMLADNLFAEMTADGKRRQETLAEKLLKAASSEPAVRTEMLKRLGDTALYVSGFFGDSLKRKIVDVDYYADIGGTAYASLASECETDLYGPVYDLFSRRFLDFVDVLTYISEKTFVQSDVDILRLYEKYVTTGSEYARDRLLELGLLTVPTTASKSRQ